MSNETQARRLVLSHPCIEEIDGFLLGTRLQLGHVPTEVMAIIEGYRRALMRGRVLPADSRCARSWVYKRNRKPVRATPATRRA